MLQRYGLLFLLTSRKTCFLTSVYGHRAYLFIFLLKAVRVSIFLTVMLCFVCVRCGAVECFIWQVYKGAKVMEK